MDYTKVVERFRRVFEKNGAIEDKEYPWFKQADSEQLNYLTELYETFSYWTRIYLNGELESLKNYRVPQSVIDFYAQCEPKGIPMTNAGIYMCDLETIKNENSSSSGGVLLKYGLITIATTIGGELICIDLNHMKNDEPKVVIIEQSYCYDAADIESYEYVCEIEHLISESFSEFIWKLSGDEYEDFEDTYLNGE